jgi:hypothetical protein
VVRQRGQASLTRESTPQQYGSPVAEQPPPTPGAESSEPDSPSDHPKSEADEPSREKRGQGAEAQSPVPTLPAPEPPLKVELVEERKPLLPKEFWLAAVSIVATAIASVVTSWMTLRTSHQHDQQETVRQKVGFAQENERAQAEFRRSQQKEAYAGFANAANDLEAAIHVQVYAIVARYPNFHLYQTLTGNADVDTSYIALLHARNLASLFGSSDVRDAAIKVIDLATIDRDHVEAWDSNHPKNSPHIPSCKDLIDFTLDTQENDRRALESAIDHFNDVARTDLKIPSLPPKPPPDESIATAVGECAENVP